MTSKAATIDIGYCGGDECSNCNGTGRYRRFFQHINCGRIIVCCTSPRVVAEYQASTSPRMGIRHFNIAGVASSYFKPNTNTKGR